MSTTTKQDIHQSEAPEAIEGHPLGLDTENILQDVIRGWLYVKKGAWVFLVLLVIIGFFIARSGAQAFGTSLTEIFVEWLKLLLS